MPRCGPSELVDSRQRHVDAIDAIDVIDRLEGDPECTVRLRPGFVAECVWQGGAGVAELLRLDSNQ